MSILKADWEIIREGYKRTTPLIMEASSKYVRGWVAPYFVDWCRYFTPIEQAAWCSIRGIGVPLYPQFPVDNKFIDFANPYLKIGVEIDGKDWHDSVKDKQRDTELARFGWKIYRIKGSETCTPYLTQCELEERGATGEEIEQQTRHWLMNTCDGVIKSIEQVFFFEDRYAYNGMCLESLEVHCYLDHSEALTT